MTSQLSESLIGKARFHLEHNEKLKKITTELMPSALEPKTIEDIFPLPASIFKHAELITDDNSQLLKTFFSSGTSGLRSSIPISHLTARRQVDGFLESWRPFLGSERRPMIILDSKPNASNLERDNSASTAASTAMMRYARDLFFLNPSKSDSHEQGHRLREWLESLNRRDLLVFGFTSQVYEFIKSDNAKFLHGLSVTMIHGGGWKKMKEKEIPRVVFYKEIKSKIGNVRILDYYGMVEQLGSVWVEDEPGLFMPPANGTALIRDPMTLEIVRDEGRVGLVQVLSNVPTSYPGHSILTEDLGSWQKSKSSNSRIRLAIHGRLPKTDPRGCSDTRL